jgi:hypothetical protein
VWPAGKWTAAQLVLHLAHDEIGWGNRVRLALTQNGYLAQPYDGAARVGIEGASPPGLALRALSWPGTTCTTSST